MQNNSNNLPDLPLPDYKTVGLSLEQEKPQVESYQQNHVAEELRLQLDQANIKLKNKIHKLKHLKKNINNLKVRENPHQQIAFQHYRETILEQKSLFRRYSEKFLT
jgi:hypothetical protein